MTKTKRSTRTLSADLLRTVTGGGWFDITIPVVVTTRTKKKEYDFEGQD